MRTRMLAVLGAAATVAAAVAGGGVATAQSTGAVYVVHGIPDTPVDVYVDGERALDDFEPLSVQGPLDLPAGSHEVAVFPADAPDNTGEAVIEATADVPADGNVSLVAHLDEAGAPTLTPYANDISAVPAGQARLAVRHDAAAPAVDVRAGGSPVISGLTNPNEQAVVVPAGTVEADVVLAGTQDVVIGPASLTLEEGTATFVHAVGSADDGTLALVPFTITGLGGAPEGVPAGSGEPAVSGALWVAGGSVLTLALAGGVLLLWRRNPAARGS
ncbi:DUF4397 domain-containing protein [Saccharomonospora piscinae]|uniref:DUF4397 domain-containing protein n=1 Tax=Saccharomonospora piscinae TaxID=687388 RepID=A0A1V9ADK5_SACPI|nr:DUF4397 domain-containing protein [Saccharomonospora piscinae]OQO95004.1 hypothetical protein B1813_02795 [Saccharomonospora piscinae]TLW90398.1 DUF4397 domain-containing protein [Saccharomonospora piscinae]